MNFTQNAWEIFNQCISDYHVHDTVDEPINNPFPASDVIEHLLYNKCWIDTVQWHLEDIIRDPKINPQEALEIKRRIDASNQERTNMVEYIDDWFLEKHKDVQHQENAKINTESPAWAVDRLSILALKIYHMREETLRDGVSKDHVLQCEQKLYILEQQHKDLSTAIEELLQDIQAGTKYMKVYRQMKMYNDDTLNPVLYKNT